MNENEIIDIFRNSGAMIEGHFILTSGLHSPLYLQCAMVLQYPQHCRAFGEILADFFRNEKIDTVASPAVGAIVLGQEVAESLGVRAVFAERKEGAMTFRRGFSIQPGERVLVVEDVVTTGGSVSEIIDTVIKAGGEPIGVVSLVDRSGGAISTGNRFGVPFRALLTMEVESFPPDDCPLCREGKQTEKPGSRGL